MPFTFRTRRRLGRHLTLNIGRRGPSLTAHTGRLSASTRGSLFVRLLAGLGWRGRWK